MITNKTVTEFVHGVRFLVGTVYLPSFTSFAGDIKWGAVSK